ncbi:hypothetical protein KSS87_016959, partial [Heliosperma pusillum]
MERATRHSQGVLGQGIKEDEEMGRHASATCGIPSRRLVMVKLLTQQFKAFRSVHKGLVRKYEGPFPVIKRVGNLSYGVELPRKLKIHLVFH